MSSAHDSSPINHRKLAAIHATMSRRFHSGVGAECIALFDVLTFVCPENPTDALRGLANFRSGRSVIVANADKTRYCRAHWFDARNSRMKLCVQSEPLDQWLAPYRLTMYADDQLGLLADDVTSVLAETPGAVLTTLELAFDFSPTTGVTASYVRRRGVFGKSLRDLSSKNQFGDWWGARRGHKRTKSYFKDAVGGHRVELRLRSGFLRLHKIRDIFEFHRLADIIPGRHVLFARLDEEQLIRQLRGKQQNADEIITVLEGVVAREADLNALLKYLRREIKLANTRRLLRPLVTNRLVFESLRKLLAQWPSTPKSIVF